MLPVGASRVFGYALFPVLYLDYVYRSCFIMASERNRTGAGPLIDPVFDYPIMLKAERKHAIDWMNK